MCWLGLHEWAMTGSVSSDQFHPTRRRCVRCLKTQMWQEGYQNSGWEGSTYESAHWQTVYDP